MTKKSKFFIPVHGTENKSIKGGFSMTNETLYKDLKSYFEKYVDTNELEIALLVQYSCATHLYGRYMNFPILHITGDYGTGKNRRINLIRKICYVPIFNSGQTSAYLFRTTEETRGTIIIDEADSILLYPEVKTFLLSGYEQESTIPRMVQDSTHIMGYRRQEFNIYGPKILITREGTDDDALNSRFITLVTLPMSADSKVPAILPPQASKEGAELLARVQKIITNFADSNSGNVSLGLRGRDVQLFECLKDTACLFGDEAIQDLKDFIKQKYIPASVYDTMLTIQQELILALIHCWDSEQRAHLTTIASMVEHANSDYRGVSSQRIARVARSLGFDVGERDRAGYYITPNDNLLRILRDRYGIEDYSMYDGIYTDISAVNVENVAEKQTDQKPDNSH